MPKELTDKIESLFENVPAFLDYLINQAKTLTWNRSPMHPDFSYYETNLDGYCIRLYDKRMKQPGSPLPSAHHGLLVFDDNNRLIINGSYQGSSSNKVKELYDVVECIGKRDLKKK